MMTPDAQLAAAGGLTGWLAHTAAVHQRLRTARHDPVTGLRAAGGAWTRQARQLLRRGHHLVLLIDLGRFKDVNAAYGHATGDQVLTSTATRILPRPGRSGGGACGADEFAIMTRTQAGGAELADLAALLAAPVTLPAGGTIPVGAVACAAPASLSSALGAAEAAMYEAKRAGGGWELTGHTTRPAAAAPARRTRHHGPGSPASAGHAAGTSRGSPPWPPEEVTHEQDHANQ